MFNFKHKWYYNSCPNQKCKRGADNDSTCFNCKIKIEKTVPRFKVQLELSDSFGSLWVTAFEEFGQLVFGKTSIEEMIDMETQGVDLKDWAERFKFQEYSLKIATKLDTRNGTSYVHNVNRASEATPERIAANNVARIKGFMGSKCLSN